MLKINPINRNNFSEVDIAHSSIFMITKVGLYLTFLLFLTGCMSNHSNKVNISSDKVEPYSFQPTIKYAKGFTIDVTPYKKVVSIYNPQSHKIEKKLTFLSNETESTPAENEVFFDAKISSIIPLSSSFFSMIDELDELDKIVAIENSNFVYNPRILEKINNEEISEVGTGTEINSEKIIRLFPDLLLLNSTPNTNVQIKKLNEAGINIATNYDWYEENGLAKAEWIKLFGALFNKDSLADVIFNRIEKRYFELKEITHSVEDSTKVIFSSDYGGTWYIPGGKSYVSQILYDAKGTYDWKNDNSTASLPLSMEVVVARSLDAEVWISPNAKSLDELANQQSVYGEFTPFKSGNIYLNDLKTNSNGGNDYYENGTLHPELILQDYIKMLHPKLIEDSAFVYFRKME